MDLASKVALSLAFNLVNVENTLWPIAEALERVGQR
jgi:hypothetical protein